MSIADSSITTGVIFIMILTLLRYAATSTTSNTVTVNTTCQLLSITTDTSISNVAADTAHMITTVTSQYSAFFLDFLKSVFFILKIINIKTSEYI